MVGLNLEPYEQKIRLNVSRLAMDFQGAQHVLAAREAVEKLAAYVQGVNDARLMTGAKKSEIFDYARSVHIKVASEYAREWAGQL